MAHPGTSCRGWPRHFRWLAAHRELGLGVASRFHIAELIGALLAEIIEATSDHDLCLTRENSVSGDFHGLQSRSTARMFKLSTNQCENLGRSPGANWNLDRSTRGHQQQVDPPCGGVNETVPAEVSEAQ